MENENNIIAEEQDTANDEGKISAENEISGEIKASEDNAENAASDKPPASNGSDKKQKKTPRGTSPPVLTLEEAISIAKKIYDVTGGEAPRSAANEITGNSPGSSVFFKKLFALRNYGLVIDENEITSLTDLGRTIVAPRDETEYAEAVKRVFLKIDVFLKIYEKFKGRPLPLDQYLINTFIDYVPKEVSSEWLNQFKRSAKFAGLLREISDGRFHVMDTPSFVPQEEVQEKPLEKVIEPPHKPKPEVPQSNSNRLPIPLGRDRLAFIELPENWNPKELNKLVSILKLALGEDSDSDA
jgi:hypothetical protein